jgi:hypothetical protein
MNDCQTARGACHLAVRRAGAVCFDQCAGYAHGQVDHLFFVAGHWQVSSFSRFAGFFGNFVRI